MAKVVLSNNINLTIIYRNLSKSYDHSNDFLLGKDKGTKYL